MSAPKKKRKRGVGRPSAYKKEYCGMLVKYMGAPRPKPFTAFGAKINVNIDTLYEWAKVHPAFSEAKKKGLQASLDALMDIGYDAIHDSKGMNPTPWIFMMKNMHGWRDKKEMTFEGSITGFGFGPKKEDEDDE